MFHVHGIRGHIFTGSLEDLRRNRSVLGIARVRRSPAAIDQTGSSPPGTGLDGASTRHGLAAASAYNQVQAPRPRQPLQCAADVMRHPVITVPANVTLGQAWQLLTRRGIGQAPVVDESGLLVGLIGRSELMPLPSPDVPSPAALAARWAQPVTTVMWSPVTSASAQTDLRRVASVLLDTGLPGVPVVSDEGAVLGFVSRTDLLRALATDPPVDLWS